MLSPLSTRREVVKSFLWATALSVVGQKVLSQSVTGQIHAAGPVYKGLLKLKIADFPVLGAANGSLRLGSSAIGSDKNPVGIYPPVIINRAADNSFFAVDARCPHAGCVVGTFKPAVSCMTCPCHSSKFKLDGTYINGPANISLIRFPVSQDQLGFITIEIEEMSVNVTIKPLSGNPRHPFKLTFLAFENITYEVRFRAFNSQTSRVVPFALTSDSPSQQSSLLLTTTPNDDTSLFIDPPTENGLIQVAIQMRTV